MRQWAAGAARGERAVAKPELRRRLPSLLFYQDQPGGAKERDAMTKSGLQ
jgi:hypothetical protein